MSEQDSLFNNLRCPLCFSRFQGSEAIQTAPFDGFEGAQQIAIVCPNCERTTHVAYTTARLEERRLLIHAAAKQAQESGDPGLWQTWRRRQRAFKRDFDIFNRKVERRVKRKGKKATA